MSRTIRRIKNKHRFTSSYLSKQYFTHDYGRICGTAWGWIPLEGKELQRSVGYYHSDRILIHCVYTYNWKQVRAKNAADLAKWAKDQDHECIFWEESNPRSWDD